MQKRKMKIPQSWRKYMRREKARIRRTIADMEEQRKLIAKLYPSQDEN